MSRNVRRAANPAAEARHINQGSHLVVGEQNRKVRNPRAEGEKSRASFYPRQSVFVSAAQREEVG